MVFRAVQEAAAGAPSAEGHEARGCSLSETLAAAPAPCLKQNLPSFNGRAPSADGHEAFDHRAPNAADALAVLHFCTA